MKGRAACDPCGLVEEDLVLAGRGGGAAEPADGLLVVDARVEERSERLGERDAARREDLVERLASQPGLVGLAEDALGGASVLGRKVHLELLHPHLGSAAEDPRQNVRVARAPGRGERGERTEPGRDGALARRPVAVDDGAQDGELGRAERVGGLDDEGELAGAEDVRPEAVVRLERGDAAARPRGVALVGGEHHQRGRAAVPGVDGGGVERPGEGLVGVRRELHLEDVGGDDRGLAHDGDDGVGAALGGQGLAEIRARHDHAGARRDLGVEQLEEELGPVLDEQPRRFVEQARRHRRRRVQRACPARARGRSWRWAAPKVARAEHAVASASAQAAPSDEREDATC